MMRSPVSSLGIVDFGRSARLRRPDIRAREGEWVVYDEGIAEIVDG